MRRRRRVVATLRLAYRVAYRLLLVWSLVARPRRRGVKCVLRAGDGRVAFVRHAYGDRAAWELPGGGAHRDESAVAAARREAREELGADAADWRELGTLQVGWSGTRLTLSCLAADWPAGAALDVDPVEIAAVAWCDPATPPQPLGPLTRVVLPLVAG